MRKPINAVLSPFGIASYAVKETMQYVYKNRVNVLVPQITNQARVMPPLSDVDIVFFDGGHDVTPSLYGAEKHPETVTNLARDFVETEMYRYYRTNPAIKFAGLCRGHQFLSVMNDNMLFQHLPDYGWGHTSRHTVQINKESSLYQHVKKDRITTNSTHHQAVHYVGKKGKPIAHEPFTGVIEAMEYDDYCRSVQWHPEDLSVYDEDNYNVLRWLYWADSFR